MNLQTVTLQECLDMYEKDDTRVVLNDGKVIQFNIFRKRENPHTDR